MRFRQWAPLAWLAIWFAICAIVYDANNQETPVLAGIVAAVVALAIVWLIELGRRRRSAQRSDAP